MRLRGWAGRRPARVYWPDPAGRDVVPALLVLLGAGGHINTTGGHLCAGTGLVVLAADAADLPHAITAVTWAADHAAELDADPDRLLVGGEGAGGALAAGVACHARDHGWPPITRQVLVRPEFGGSPLARSLAGVAPATVLTSGPDRYAARLREAGVEVEELQVDDPQRGLAELVAALRHALGSFRGRPVHEISRDPDVDFGQPNST